MAHTREEITQEKFDTLVEDASYLQDEAEALKYVIDEVPYGETPPGGQSIIEMLLLIDHAQLSYYRPVLEKAFNDPRPTHLKDFDYFEESFVLDPGKAENIQNVLSKIAKHRAGLVNVIKNIPLIDWGSKIYKDNKELTLYDFVRQMIRFERSKLKEIADLVLVFDQEKQAHKEIEKRAGNHLPSNEKTENRS